MAIDRSKLAVVVLGGLALLWLLALFVGLPYLYGKKVEALVGHDMATVESQLGPPTQRWSASDFRCHPDFPCQGSSTGGPVLLYASQEEKQGWYLHFDAQGKLIRLEAVGRGR